MAETRWNMSGSCLEILLGINTFVTHTLPRFAHTYAASTQALLRAANYA